MQEQKAKPGPDKTINGLDPAQTGVASEGRVTPVASQAPPITIGQIISLITDTEKLVEIVRIEVLFTLL